MTYERTDRKFNEYRNLKMTTGFISSADGSVLIEMGRTRVICNATLLPKVPDWLAGKGTGWITAEYSLLPQSTGKRVERERKGASGRTQEIQRLVGRSLRGAADLAALGENAIVVDCDVIEADGGTRTASIIGGFVALAIALKKIKDHAADSKARHYRDFRRRRKRQAPLRPLLCRRLRCRCRHERGDAGRKEFHRGAGHRRTRKLRPQNVEHAA